MLLPLHVKHHINNVLQHLGASNVPRFGHMAHQEDGDVMWLGNMQQSCGTLPHLWQRQTSDLKHLPNVETHLCCPQAFLSLDFQCRDDGSKLKRRFHD